MTAATPARKRAPRKAPATIVAASHALPLGDAAAAKTWKFGLAEWQGEGWRLYDTTSELRFIAGWVGDSLAQGRLYVAELDENGEPIGEVTEPWASEIPPPLGSGDERDDNLRLVGVDLAVSGECWMLGVGAAKGKPGAKWSVLTGSQIKRTSKEIVATTTTGKVNVVDGKDLLIRCWRPHPNAVTQADSPTRAALVPLREIELLTKREFAELESRLTGPGIWPVPEGIDYPRGSDDPPGIAGFMALLQRTLATAIRDQGSAASVAPIVLPVPDHLLALMRDPIRFWSDLSGQIGEMKRDAISRVATPFEMPNEVMEGLGRGNHWCKKAETEALTPSGWRSGIQPGDIVLTLAHESGIAQWSPVLDVYRARVEHEPMLTVELSSGHGGKRFEVTGTPEHRYPVIRNGDRLIVTGRQLRRGDLLTRGAIAPAPDVATLSDDLVRLLAWYSADGTLTGSEDRPGQIRIAKSWRRNPGSTAQLVSVLSGVFGPPRESMPLGIGPAWRMEKQARGMAVAVLNAPARDIILGLVQGKEKVIPSALVDKMTSAQRETFISAWMDSDGTRGRAILQRDARRLDAVEYAAILVGRPVRRFVKSSTGFKPGSMHGLSIGKVPTAVVIRVRETAYTGEVWCPVTETGTWLAREPGGWTEYTGNSAWLISEEAIKRLKPYATPPADALTRSYLRPLIAERKLGDPDRFAYVLDLSALAAKPNQLEAATLLHDRGLIQDRVLVRAAGMQEADMPTAAEAQRQLASRLMTTSPALAQVPELAELVGLPVSRETAPTPAPPREATALPPAEVESRAAPDMVTASAGTVGWLRPDADPRRLAMALVNQAVMRAMEIAGGRLVRHDERARFPNVPRHALSAHFGAVAEFRAVKALEGAWRAVPAIADALGWDAEGLTELLDGYCRALLTHGREHQPAMLDAVLSQAAAGRA